MDDIEANAKAIADQIIELGGKTSSGIITILDHYRLTLLIAAALNQREKARALRLEEKSLTEHPTKY